MQLVPEMTYTETIDGPWGPTTGSPLGSRICWQVTEAHLAGPRVDARLVMPGADWMRLGPDGVRRQDLRATLRTADGAVVLLQYDVGVIRESETFLSALQHRSATTFADQYMCMVPQFDTGDHRYGWLMDNLFVGEGRLAGDHRIEYQIYRIASSSRDSPGQPAPGSTS
jgi:hypothetical protein